MVSLNEHMMNNESLSRVSLKMSDQLYFQLGLYSSHYLNLNVGLHDRPTINIYICETQ